MPRPVPSTACNFKMFPPTVVLFRSPLPALLPAASCDSKQGSHLALSRKQGSRSRFPFERMSQRIYESVEDTGKKKHTGKAAIYWIQLKKHQFGHYSTETLQWAQDKYFYSIL